MADCGRPRGEEARPLNKKTALLISLAAGILLLVALVLVQGSFHSGGGIRLPVGTADTDSDNEQGSVGALDVLEITPSTVKPAINTLSRPVTYQRTQTVDVSPDLRTRTVRVTLEPGRAPVKVFTTANIATSLVFHDSTGQPWPITSVTNGGPSSFQVLRPELPEGNLLNVMPIQGYATSTLVVTLENRDIPLVIRLESDSVRAPERKADALVLIQLAHHGPKAAIPLTSTIKETASSAMLSFLDRVPPDDAVRLRSEPDSDAVMAWKYNGKHYVRTTHSLMWPAWTAVVNGAGSTKCYELPVTTRIMLSREGSVQTILLKNTLK